MGWHFTKEFTDAPTNNGLHHVGQSTYILCNTVDLLLEISDLMHPQDRIDLSIMNLLSLGDEEVVYKMLVKLYRKQGRRREMFFRAAMAGRCWFYMTGRLGPKGERELRKRFGEVVTDDYDIAALHLLGATKHKVI